jgi:hypothetical protein
MQENVMTDKYCTKCRTVKVKDEFYKSKSNKDGLQSYCKPCNLLNNRNILREKKYGVCPTQWEIMMKRCGGKCELCGNENKGGDALCIDHNHETNEVRGLLCHNCNRGLGFLKDSAELVKKAATYLEERGQYGV